MFGHDQMCFRRDCFGLFFKCFCHALLSIASCIGQQQTAMMTAMDGNATDNATRGGNGFQFKVMVTARDGNGRQ